LLVKSPHIANTMLDLIGNTPLVKINKLSQNANSEVYAKLEMFNPASSIKDRIAKAMVEDAEEKGLIIPGISTIIEATSGNTGIGLAMVAAIKGYKCIIVLSDTMSLERRKTLLAFGAEIVLTPGQEGFQSVIKKTEELLIDTPFSWSPMQFNNEQNPHIHYSTTGKEIFRDTRGEIDILVCGLGTGGTITGIAKYLKQKNPNIKTIAVEPENCALLSGGSPGLHKIQGLNAGFIADTTDINFIDEAMTVTDEEAIEMTRNLAKNEGIFVGISSGAAAHVAIKVARETSNKKIVVIFPDTGERYLSTEVWN
jgi:cysteine synthase A